MLLFRRNRAGIIKKPNQDKAVMDKVVKDKAIKDKAIKDKAIKDKPEKDKSVIDNLVVDKSVKDNSIRYMAVNTRQEEINFTSHISKYIGKTVTVFVDAGGPAGLGFTGILSDVDGNSLKLIVNTGPPPACPVINLCCKKCNGPLYGFLNLYNGPHINTVHHYCHYMPRLMQDGFHVPYAGKPVINTGSTAYILTPSVTAFVHNLN